MLLLPLVAWYALFRSLRSRRRLVEWAWMLVISALSAVALTAMARCDVGDGGPLPILIAVPMIVPFLAVAARFFHQRMLRAGADRFTMALFRRFHGESSRLARTVVAPTLGAYGRVRLVVDADFEVWQGRDLLGVRADDATEPEEQLNFTDEAWRRGVLDLLGHVDVAVFDLSAQSDNLAWELMQSLSHLPAERLLFIVGSAGGGWAPVLPELAASHGDGGLERRRGRSRAGLRCWSGPASAGASIAG